MSAAIAIIGAGPSGCYTAQALRRALPDADIVIFERRTTPYGLVKYGVAPDHIGTKAVTRQFDRLWEREGIRLVLGHEIGREITLETLGKSFNAVVLATGLSQDRRLGIVGEGLLGVIPSGVFAAYVNGDISIKAPHLGQRIAVIGNGNVALDVVRLLAKTPEALATSQMPQEVIAHLAADAREITLIGRGAPEAARFDAGMLAELKQLERCSISVEVAYQQSSFSRLISETDHENARRIHFMFEKKPVEILGQGAVSGLVLEGNAGRVLLNVDTVITAIGFEAAPQALKADAPHLFTVGWAHYGARGTLPDARLDAKRCADAILASECLQAKKVGFAGLNMI